MTKSPRPTLFPHRESGTAAIGQRVHETPSVLVKLVEIQNKCASCTQKHLTLSLFVNSDFLDESNKVKRCWVLGKWALCACLRADTTYAPGKCAEPAKELGATWRHRGETPVGFK